ALLFSVANRQPIGNLGILYFGIGAVWTYVLVFFSINPSRKRTNRRWLYFARVLGANYILLLFVLDFVIAPLRSHGGYSWDYVPFAVLTVGAPALRGIAFIVCRSAESKPARRQESV